MKYKLYAADTCGSTVIEVLLKILNLPHTVIDLGADPNRKKAEKLLNKLNPLGQIPILTLPNKEIMTESAAMIFYLCEQRNGMSPSPRSPARAEFYRWVTYLAANIYPLIGTIDHPEYFVDKKSQQELVRTRAEDRIKYLWKHMESEIRKPSPYILGTQMSALDIYVAMMSKWRPRRKWFNSHCPKLSSAVKATEKHPVVSEIFALRFN